MESTPRDLTAFIMQPEMETEMGTESESESEQQQQLLHGSLGWAGQHPKGQPRKRRAWMDDSSSRQQQAAADTAATAAAACAKQYKYTIQKQQQQQQRQLATGCNKLQQLFAAHCEKFIRHQCCKISFNILLQLAQKALAACAMLVTPMLHINPLPLALPLPLPPPSLPPL